MWLYLTLLSTLISSAAMIVNKKLLKTTSATFLTWITLVLATPFVFLFTFKTGFPKINSYFVLAILSSCFLYTLAKVIGYKAIRLKNLSALYPLTALGPVFTLFFAAFPPLSEIPNLPALAGCGLVILGSYFLNVNPVKRSYLKPFWQLIKDKASVLMIISILFYSGIIIFDKLAIQNTFPANSSFTLLIENLVVIVVLIPVMALKVKNIGLQIRRNYKHFLLLGILSACSTAITFSVINKGNVGLIKTIMQTEILFVLLLSFVFFKDKPKKQTIIASAIMILGVMLIKTGV